MSDINIPKHLSHYGVPLSGGVTQGATGIYHASYGSICVDSINGCKYINEGSSSSPYWTPMQSGNPHDIHLAVGDTVAIAGTDASVFLTSGVRVFGDGLPENDSGLVLEAAAEKNLLKQMRTSDAIGNTLALGRGNSVSSLQPDVNGPIVIDVVFTNNTAITERSLFLGFAGAAIDAFLEPCTGSGTTITFNNVSGACDDVAGMFLDTGLTDTDGIFFPSTKEDAAATVETGDTLLSQTIDLSKTMTAAGTDTRWRVQLDSGGRVTVFINKVVVGYRAALSADEEIYPVFCLGTNATSVKSVDVTSFQIWHQ